jgi:hypothetical protein
MQDNRPKIAKGKAAKIKEAYSKLLEKQAEERADLASKQAEERALFKTEARGKAGNLVRLAAHQGGRWVLYRRPWTDSGPWQTFCLSMMQGKRVRMFTFGWNGSRLSQNGDTAILKAKFDPKVLTWVEEACKLISPLA